MDSRPKIVAFPTRRQADGNATIMENSEEYLREAIALAYANAEKGGRPFGAVIVRDGRIIAKAINEISATGDPTSHAELNAIRLASKSLGADPSGCAVFARGHPGAMFMAAMRLPGSNAGAYAYSNEDVSPHAQLRNAR